MKPPLLPVSAGTDRRTTLEVRPARVIAGHFPAGLRIPAHIHERACMTVVLGGRFEERLLGRGCDLVPGTVLVKPPTERHDNHFSALGSEQLILEPPADAADLLSPAAALFAGVHHFRNATIQLRARRLVQELHTPDDLSAMAIEGLVLDLFASAARLVALSGPDPLPPWLDRVHDLLHDRYAEPLQIQEIAREVGVHPAYLARMFSRRFGCTIGEYVRRLRIERAARDLEHTELPIVVIALECGYADHSHFTRTFKRVVGMTPSAYRSATRTVHSGRWTSRGTSRRGPVAQRER